MGAREIGFELRSLLYGDPACWGLLEGSGCGWVDGGCRTLMRALLAAFGDAAVPYQIVPDAAERHSWHALVRVGDWYIDGDGASTAAELEHRWLEEEGLISFVLRPFDPDAEPPDGSGEPGFCLPAADVEALADAIRAGLGTGIGAVDWDR